MSEDTELPDVIYCVGVVELWHLRCPIGQSELESCGWLGEEQWVELNQPVNQPHSQLLPWETVKNETQLQKHNWKEEKYLDDQFFHEYKLWWLLSQFVSLSREGY